MLAQDEPRSDDVARTLALSREGDEAASRKLIEHLYPLVARVVRANLPRGAAEEDVQQEVFLKIFTSLEQYRGEAPLEHWVSRVAVNACLDQLRKHKSRPELRWSDLSPEELAVLNATMADTTANQALDAREARDLVDRLLECLKPEYRVVVRMLDLEERSVPEIAMLTGWSQTLVRVRAFRARRKLRALLARTLKENKDA